MKKTYIIDGYKFKFEEGTQPENAILVESKKVEPKKTIVESEDKEETKVAVKVRIPKNKSKGVKTK